MVEYTLLGQTVQFDDAAERFFDLQLTASHPALAAAPGLKTGQKPSDSEQEKN